MPLVGSALKAKMSERIFQGLKREFADVSATAGYSPVAEEHWKKLADAISDAALDIVTDIQTNAIVMPGIPLVAGAFGGSTIGPGKIS